MTNMRTNKIYTWKNDVNHQLASMEKVTQYNAQENAESLAELFASGLPNSTLDVIYKAIADKIRKNLNYYPEGLNRTGYIESIIRSVMDELAYKEKDN